GDDADIEDEDEKDEDDEEEEEHLASVNSAVVVWYVLNYTYLLPLKMS
ncbi:hypothetical protein Tco_0694643, partial [Tanacetum coccineum]